MRLWSTSSLILAMAAVVSAQEDKKVPAADTAAPPSTPKAPEQTKVTPTDTICKVCNCSAAVIDCMDKGIDAFFTEGDWAGLLASPYANATTLDLSSNSIANLQPFPELPNLKTLNLSRCGIKTLEEATFKELANSLTTLDLSYNDLTTANLKPEVFVGPYSPIEWEPLSALRTLDLSHNQLHSLHKDLFEHLSDVTTLILSYNSLGLVDQASVVAVAGLPRLQELKMRGCQLTELPERFLHTPRDLQLLDISDNLLQQVPQELREAKHLVMLNLNQNPIKRLVSEDPDYPGFPPLPRLEELHMCNMEKLTSIGEYTLGDLSALKILHLNNNPALREIAPKALARVDEVGENYVWPPLEQLEISHTNVTALDSRLVSRWDRLRALRVGDNPYVCDCTTQWMVDVLVPIADRLQANASAGFVCATPVEMLGKTMQYLNAKSSRMRCLDKYNHRPERDGALLLGALIGVLLAVPMVLGGVLLWKRGHFAMCGAPGPSNFNRAFYKRAETSENFYI